MARKMLIDGEVGSTTEEPLEYDYDLFVIGAGSGGVRASRTSAAFGAKAAICELPFHPISSDTLGGVGGTCVIRGCVPKKILVYGAVFQGEFEDARNFGWELPEHIDFDWPKLLHNKTQEITRLNEIYKRLLANAGVTLFEAEGKVVGPHAVELTEPDGTKRHYSAKHILISTGGRAHKVNIHGNELAITSDEALSLEAFPKRAVILGGGYIAVEFASIWRGMGASVDLFYRKELPLRRYYQIYFAELFSFWQAGKINFVEITRNCKPWMKYWGIINSLATQHTYNTMAAHRWALHGSSVPTNG